jgi:6-phosphogluconolactonase (cycloisomerase 2 family)
MKKMFMPLLLAGALGLAATAATAATGASQANQFDVLIGTYTGATSKGIYRYRFDSATGQLGATPLQVVNSENPSWLTLNHDQSRVYVVNENGPGAKDNLGKVSTFTLDHRTHELKFSNQVLSRGDEPTYSSLATGEQHLFVASYAVHPDPGGNLAVLAIDRKGDLTSVVQQETYAASKVNPERQVSSHVHSVVSSPDGRFVYVQDLGADKVFIYRYDASKTSHPLTPASPASVALPPGSGPRHLLFSADGKHAYLTLEMAAQVAVFDVDQGNLVRQQLVDLAPAQAADHKAGAALHFSADGKLLYVTNRGTSGELLVFGVDGASGRLTELQRRSVEGVEPREFSIDPSGKYVLIANQKSNQIVVVKRDPATGLLGATTQTFAIDSPSDIKFLK